MPESIVYVDTSAAAKLLLGEPEASAVADFLNDLRFTFVSSDLLQTELRRVCVRGSLDQARAGAVIDQIDLYSLDRLHYREAGFYPEAALRSLDALHLVAALHLDVDAILTYDHRLAQAARDRGIEVYALPAGAGSSR